MDAVNNQSPRKKILSILTVLVFCLTSLTIIGQDDTKTRSITSDDFASQRPTRKSRSSNKNSSNRRITYKFVRRDKNVVKRKPSKTGSKDTTANTNKTVVKTEKVSEIGLTVWRLRPPRESDIGVKLPVLDTSGVRKMWVAERVNPEKGFQAGERVRIAIESSYSGYLYVINSEIYSNGTYGEPSLIFPVSVDDKNNLIRPGVLVDIPDQTEDLPYFLINPKKENYMGELLTVIISPNRLTSLKIDSNGKIKNLDSLIDLEEDAEAEIFSRTDSQDKTYSITESEAACGAKVRKANTRQLERPCGEKTRELTREEPLPQTIYRVKTIAGQPTVTFITLNVRK